MRIRNEITEVAALATEWRHALHRNPQTSYEEVFASDFVAAKLMEWGINHERNWAGTGIVATIPGKNTDSGKAIGLRADIDALNIRETPNKPWASEIDGKMHGCGHDGHTVMLLTAAKYLQETRDFNGTVHLIFQPAEEGGNGAHKMIEQGLFEKYRMDAVFGLHNWPWLPQGKIAMCPGPIMAGDDVFTATIQGKGGHAAMPHRTRDPIPAMAGVIQAVQNIVSRETDPLETVVVSITNANAGTGAFNVIPDRAVIQGSVRTLLPEKSRKVEKALREIFEGNAITYAVKVAFEYEHCVGPTVNHPEQTALCAVVASEIVGEENVDANVTPAMTAEDFGAMLQEVPGCYIWLGQATGKEGRPCNHGLHTPDYDFNDDVIAIGAEYWVRLAEKALRL